VLYLSLLAVTDCSGKELLHAEQATSPTGTHNRNRVLFRWKKFKFGNLKIENVRFLRRWSFVFVVAVVIAGGFDVLLFFSSRSVAFVFGPLELLLFPNRIPLDFLREALGAILKTSLLLFFPYFSFYNHHSIIIVMLSKNNSTSSLLLMLGNPGTGKSTLLNALIGKVVFRSGVSFGRGMTLQFQLYRQGGPDDQPPPTIEVLCTMEIRRVSPMSRIVQMPPQKYPRLSSKRWK
jgi:hypothetical protein